MIKSASRSSIANNEKFRSMSVGNVPSSEFLIQTVTVGATPASLIQFDLSSFSSVYRHLVFKFALRDNRVTSGGNYALLTFNSTPYFNSAHRLLGIGSGFSQSSEINQTSIKNLVSLSSQDPASTFSTGTMEILDAYHPSKNKVARAHFGYNGGDSRNYVTSGLWASTEQISTISFECDAGASFVQGTRISVYGVTS